jgi:PAS domain S-box-containing protein
VPAVLGQLALLVVDRIPAMVAYWDTDEICRFANRAYLDWFGRTREQIVGFSIRHLLGPIYELNAPYFRAAFTGEAQMFERVFPRPDGSGSRDGLVSYIPDLRDGVVHGVFVHVADISPLKLKERELQALVAERDRMLAQVTTLEGLLNICSGCKRIHTDGDWQRIEQYVAERTNASFTHGICPDCLTRMYPEFARDEPTSASVPPPP